MPRLEAVRSTVSELWAGKSDWNSAGEPKWKADYRLRLQDLM